MYKQLLKLAFPVILSQGIQTVIILSDRYILSLKDPLLTSAATTGGFTAMSLSLFFVHLLLFATSLIGKRYGQNEPKQCRILLSQCLLIATCCIPILLLLREFGDFYFTFLKHPISFRALETGYFKIIMLSYIPVLYRTALESYFLGIGKTRGILYASLVGIIANIPISYFLVLGPYANLFEGAGGAAWGTFIASLLSFLFLGYFYYRNESSLQERITRNEIMRSPDWQPLLRQGSYTGMEKFANSFCFVCFVNMFVCYGKEVSTAIAIVFSWDQIAFLPLMGIYGALLSLYSRLLGQKTLLTANKCLHAALIMTFGLMLLFSLVFWTSSHALAALYLGKESVGMDRAAVFAYSTFFLHTTCFYIFANAAIFLYKAALRSLGLSDWCFRYSLIVHLALVAGAYYAVYFMKMQPTAVWSLFLGALTLLSIIFSVKFYATSSFSKNIIYKQ